MTQVDVAIVGAGAAGIAAARRLRAAGRTIALLEARNRVGGRCAIDLSLGVPADIGAAWLHFATDNAWSTLAAGHGFTIDRRPAGWGADAWIGLRPPGPAERAQAARDFERYDAQVSAAATAGRDVPVSEVVPDDAFRPRFDAVMTWAVGMESSAISTLDLHRYAESDDNWSVHEGLGAVVAAAAAELQVCLDARVTAIDWGGDTVRIDSTAGRIEAGAAIVTVPTAVLARGAVQFSPPLPAAHRDAIEALPLGVCNKVFFRVREGSHFGANLPRQFMGTAATSRTCNWEWHPGGQPLLMAFLGGDLSRELEHRGELAAFAKAELTRLFGHAVHAEFDGTLATAWGSDPFSLGSYSAARPGRADSRAQLAAPVSPRLLFAGEACAIHHFGTLHGAWLSGVAAAEQLL